MKMLQSDWLNYLTLSVCNIDSICAMAGGHIGIALIFQSFRGTVNQKHNGIFKDDFRRVFTNLLDFPKKKLMSMCPQLQVPNNNSVCVTLLRIQYVWVIVKV